MSSNTDVLARLDPAQTVAGIEVKPVSLGRLRRVSQVIYTALQTAKMNGIDAREIMSLVNNGADLRNLISSKEAAEAEGMDPEETKAIETDIARNMAAAMGGMVEAGQAFAIALDFSADFIVAATGADKARVDDLMPEEAAMVLLQIWRANGDRLKNLFTGLWQKSMTTDTDPEASA